jgi:phosphatidylserine decarboxylase
MKIRLHREGKASLIITFIVTVVVTGLAFFLLKNTSFIWVAYIITVGMLVLAAIMVNFFRNPLRTIEIDEDVIYAPCDGKVVVIEQILENEYFNQKMVQVSIFMSPFNVHVNRNPITGIIKFSKYYKGKYLMAWNPKSSTENERTYVVAEGKNITVGYKQIAGGLARRIVNYVKVGDSVFQGREFGFIKLGSRMDIILPLNAKVVVKLNDVAVGGKTVIAKIKS